MDHERLMLEFPGRTMFASKIQSAWTISVSGEPIELSAKTEFSFPSLSAWFVPISRDDCALREINIGAECIGIGAAFKKKEIASDRVLGELVFKNMHADRCGFHVARLQRLP